MRILYSSNIDIRMEGADKTHFVEIVQNLVRLGHNVRMLLPGYAPRQLQNLGFDIHYVPTFRKGLLAYLWFECLRIPHLIYSIISFKPDLIYAPQGLFDSVLPFVARILQVPYVSEKNGLAVDEFRLRHAPPLLLWLLHVTECLTLRSSDRIICVTEGIRRELGKRYGISESKMVVIPNGANTEAFKPMNQLECRRILGLDEISFVVGFVGSFARYQGLEDLVVAAKRVSDQGARGITYVLVGDGEMEMRVKQLVDENGLQGSFVFTGRVPYRSISTYINAFDIGVAPFPKARNAIIGLSPLKLYEYLACGRPVITSRIDGVKEIIEACRGGYLFEPGNIAGLAQQIMQAYQDRKELPEQGQRGACLIAEKYSWLAIARQVEQVLKPIASRRASLRTDGSTNR